MQQSDLGLHSLPKYIHVHNKTKLMGVYKSEGEAPVAKWVKCLPTGLADPSLSPAQGKIFSTVNKVLLQTAFHYDQPIVLI